jgi:hypothetical protein
MKKYYPYLKEHGSKLIDLGYKIIPIPPGEKRPFEKGWPNIDADQHQLDGWLNNGDEKSGVGILTGEVVAIDIDVYDEEYVGRIVEYCHKHFGVSPIRVGKRPKALLVYRTEEPFKKETSTLYEGLTGKAQVEILGKGQQFVAYNIHPDTEKPYKWEKGELFNTRKKDLPVITWKQVSEFIDYFETNIPEDFEILQKESKSTATNVSNEPLENYTAPKGISLQDAQRLLDKLDPDMGYHSWYKVRMALYHEFEGSIEAFDLWQNWSMRGKKYVVGDCERWDGFKVDLTSAKPVTIRRIEKMVKSLKEESTTEPPPGIFFMSLEQLRSKLGPINWTVENYIESNTTGSIFGDPGTFKSFLALDLSLHIACGIPWHGNATKQGQVFYIAGEGHNGLARRVGAWLKERNQSDNHIPIRFSTGAINFIEETIADQVSKEVESLKSEYGDPALIVIDTVARNFGSGDENSTSDMGAFVKNVDSLRRKNECVVLLIHHTGKKEKNQGRGSSALKGAMDFEFKVEKKEGFNVSLRCTKMKDAEEPLDTWFNGRKVILDENLQIDSLVFDKVDSPAESQTIGEQIFELIQDLADLKTGQVKRSELNSLADDERINANTYRSCLARLKKEGKIDVKDDQDGDIILRIE